MDDEDVTVGNLEIWSHGLVTVHPLLAPIPVPLLWWRAGASASDELSVALGPGRTRRRARRLAFADLVNQHETATFPACSLFEVVFSIDGWENGARGWVVGQDDGRAGVTVADVVRTCLAFLDRVIAPDEKLEQCWCDDGYPAADCIPCSASGTRYADVFPDDLRVGVAYDGSDGGGTLVIEFSAYVRTVPSVSGGRGATLTLCFLVIPIVPLGAAPIAVFRASVGACFRAAATAQLDANACTR